MAISDLNKLDIDLGKLMPKMREKIKKHHRMYSRFEEKEVEWLDVGIVSESDIRGEPPVLPESSMSEVSHEVIKKYQLGDQLRAGKKVVIGLNGEKHYLWQLIIRQLL